MSVWKPYPPVSSLYGRCEVHFLSFSYIPNFLANQLQQFMQLDERCQEMKIISYRNNGNDIK